MLSRDELRHLSMGSGGTFIFDLSKIRHTNLEPLMKSLETYGIPMVRSLTFNINLKKTFPDSLELRPLISYSIASVVTNYFKRLVLLLKRMLPESTILKEVHFDGIKITQGELGSLSKVISAPSSLSLIEFKDIQIFDKDVSNLFRGFGSSKIPKIIFSNCNITDESTDAIVEYLNKYTASHGIKRIPHIELPNNNISKYSINQILKASHKKIDSESSCDGSSVGLIHQFDELTDNDLKEQEDVKSQSSKIELDSSFSNFFGTKLKFKNYGDLPDQILMAENEKLRTQIQRLRLLIEEINNNDGLFIVGDGVYSVTEFMKAIEKRLNDIVI